MIYFFAGIGLILAGGIIAEFMPGRIKAVVFSIFTFLGTVLLVLVSTGVIISGLTVSKAINLSSIIGDADFVIDRLSAFFVLFISVMSFVGTIFAAGYIRHYLDEKRNLLFHFMFMAILIVSMIIIPVVQNALAFLIIWELMSLSSFMLVVFESESSEVLESGISYLISMHIGVVFLITGFVFLSIKSGSLNFSTFKDVITSNKSIMNLMFIFFFTGFGTKAGFVPFHTWLPKAHPAAPGHISAMMSGIMINTGIYGILRVLNLIGTPTIQIPVLIIIISVITAFTGISYAVYERDIKKILAYSTVENIGIIGLAAGIGCMGLVFNNPYMAALGFSGALMHTFNHSVFKMLLFFGAGYVNNVTHTRNIEKLGGLAKVLPKTAFFFFIGSIAICGLPPLNGFISEAVIFFSMMEGIRSDSVLLYSVSILSIAVLALIGSMAVIGFTRIYSIVFSGEQRSVLMIKEKKENKAVLFSMLVLSLGIMIIGLCAAPFFDFFMNISSVFVSSDQDFINRFTNLFFYISVISAALIVLTVILSGLKFLLLKFNPGKETNFKTWDCGYQKFNPKMQYTASSYSDGFVRLIKPFIRVNVKSIIPIEKFPKGGSFNSASIDRIEEYIIKPCIKGINIFFNFFSVIQSRNIKHYLIYVMIYIVTVILVIVGIK